MEDEGGRGGREEGERKSGGRNGRKGQISDVALKCFHRISFHVERRFVDQRLFKLEEDVRLKACI